MITTFFYRHNQSGKAPAIVPRLITCCDLTFVLKGTFSYTVNNQPIEIHANEAIMLQKGSFYKREKSNNCDYVSFNFYSDDIIDLPLHIMDIPYEIKLLIAVCDEFQKNYSAYEEKINTILIPIIHSLQEYALKQLESPLVRQIKKYIREHLSEKLTLKTLSDIVGYTPNYCDYLFQKETGTSMIRYLINERITEAKRLLAEGILSLKKIAFSVGFDDYNYFCRAFKKNEGVTPSAFKITNNPPPIKKN